jgi:hypothetical protein
VTHVQFLGSAQERVSDPECLHDPEQDHGGACYTPELREERGFGKTCAYRGIGKPPNPPQCSEPVRPNLGGSSYCSRHRCLWHPKGQLRCSVLRDFDGAPEGSRVEYCRVHQGVAQKFNEIFDSVSKDAPTVTEANGAKQSMAAGAFTSVDPLVMFRIAQIQKLGDEKYGVDNWRRLPERDHVNHALAHLYAYLAGDTGDDHLGHAVVRAMFALAVNIRPEHLGEDGTLK